MNRSELLQKLIERIGYVLKTAHIQHITKEDHQHESLGRPQLTVLFNLAKSKGKGMTAKEISQLLGVTSGAVTQLIDGLVAKQLVIRTDDPNDRRVVRMYLSDLAQSKFKEFKKGFADAMEGMFKDISDEELIQLITILDKIKIDKDKNFF